MKGPGRRRYNRVAWSPAQAKSPSAQRQEAQRRAPQDQFFLYVSLVVTGPPPPWKSGRVDSSVS
jgi:hypothetical protein